MSAIIPFTPSNMTAPRFTAILDGSQHSISVTWNISSQRYYVNIYGLNGDWVLTTALVTTPTGEAIEAAVYDRMSGIVTCTKRAGLYRPPGQIVRYTLQGFDPPALNGLWRCLTLDTLTFSFPIDTDPGDIIQNGSANRLMNMIAGKFQQSTLVYRNGSFEVNP